MARRQQAQAPTTRITPGKAAGQPQNTAPGGEPAPDMPGLPPSAHLPARQDTRARPAIPAVTSVSASQAHTPSPTVGARPGGVPPTPDRGVARVTAAADARTVYGRALPAAICDAHVRAMLSPECSNLPSAELDAQDVLARMHPRDPIEEILGAQILLTHHRMLRLSALAAGATSTARLRVVHERADHAAGTLRRLIQTLNEYRRPHRTGDSYLVVQQANIAGRQVVHHGASTSHNATNEQGSQDGGA